MGPFGSSKVGMLRGRDILVVALQNLNFLPQGQITISCFPGHFSSGAEDLFLGGGGNKIPMALGP